jgi:hypothetical protein
MFKCRICEEKEKRISDLLSQVEMLKTVAYPNLNKRQLSLEDRERDHLLSGSDEMIDVPNDPASHEEAMILMGSYDNAQIEVE